MKTNFAPGLRTVVLAASSMLAASAGCSSNCGTNEKPVAAAAAAVSIPETPRGTAAQSKSVVSTSARDLADSQPDSVVAGKGGTRDLDLGGGGGGGGNQSGQLSYQALGEALHQLGVAAEDKQTFYSVKVKATTPDNITWSYPVTVSLSRDSSIVWVSCNLVQVGANGTPAPQTLISLLAANFQMGTTFFSVDTQPMLMLQHPFENAGITPEVLGAHLKLFFTNLKASEPVYKTLTGTAGEGGGGGGGGGNPFQ